ncbi:MAG: pyrimidine-nucleoside phosphorylase [Thermoflexaceae bacterium]|nr:pyrimidine-nucleoside phosphorylase [Thermoflexaceae bacterium]
MRMFDLIMKKRNGGQLTQEELHDIISGYVEGTIPDYQMSALLMAIYYKGMSKEETVALTMEMAESGDMLDLSAIHGVKVDKHSTGGIGDKTTLIVGPMVASLGIPVAKMSGRGLGYTGGTIDKLESFEGFSTAMSVTDFVDHVNSMKFALTGQTGNLAPADKKIYALRDVTATVDSIPLIASSIMSKKIASGADVIILDVKIGSGAFMKDLDSARKLAKTMVDIGKDAGRKMAAVISDMDQPLGLAVGNALEVMEAMDVLKGKGPKDVRELCIILGMYMVNRAKPEISLEEAKKLLTQSLDDGTALEKFREFLAEQGGNPDTIDDYSLLPNAKLVQELKSEKEGYLVHMEADEIGASAMILGAGREKKEDIINPAAGIVLNKKINDYVHVGDTLAYLHGDSREKLSAAAERMLGAYEFADAKREGHQLVYEIVE